MPCAHANCYTKASVLTSTKSQLVIFWGSFPLPWNNYKSTLCILAFCLPTRQPRPNLPSTQPNYWPPHYFIPNSPVQVDQEEFHIQWLQKQVDIFPRQAHGLHLTSPPAHVRAMNRKGNAQETFVVPEAHWILVTTRDINERISKMVKLSHCQSLPPWPVWSWMYVL